MASWLVVAIGALLVAIGTAGTLSPERFVEIQQREGMSPYADESAITREDRVRVTRYVGAAFVVVGVATVVVGTVL